MHERVLAALGFWFAIGVVAVVHPSRGIYPDADQPIVYGLLFFAVFAAAFALFYLVIGLLSRPLGARKDAIAGSGGETSSASAALGWREKLAPAVLFCAGSMVAAYTFATSVPGLSTVVNGLGSALLFGFGFSRWFASIEQAVGLRRGSRAIPGATRLNSIPTHEWAYCVAFTVAAILFRMLPEAGGPVSFLAGLLVTFSLTYGVCMRVQGSVRARFEDADGRTTGSASVSEPQAEAT